MLPTSMRTCGVRRCAVAAAAAAQRSIGSSCQRVWKPSTSARSECAADSGAVRSGRLLLHHSRPLPPSPCRLLHDVASRAFSRIPLAAETPSSAPLPSTAALTRSVPAHPGLPAPPPFPVAPFSYSPSTVAAVSDTLATPSVLRPWPVLTTCVRCPLIVDHCNVALALAHRLGDVKRKRALRRLAMSAWRAQRDEQSARTLSRVELRMRKAIERCVQGGGLGPLPGWSPQDVREVMTVRNAWGGRGGARGMAKGERLPPFTRHQLKMADVVERWRWRRHLESLKGSGGQQPQPGNEADGREDAARRKPPPVTPDRYRLPGHVQWLLRQRQRMRVAEARQALEDAPPPVLDVH